MSDVNEELGRPQSWGEELANSVSHGIGLLLSVLAVPFLISRALRTGSGWDVVGASVFAVAAVLLYLTSTLYHALPHGKAKRVFNVLDHIAIFILIAGTYTPFTLGALRGAWGWTLFGLVWGIAVAGILMKILVGTRYRILSTLLYVGMGWLFIVAARPAWLHIQVNGLLWLMAGGLTYTVGVLFFVADHRRYNHFVWHLFVLLGTACHYCAVFWYAA
jgi:hemolysin III